MFNTVHTVAAYVQRPVLTLLLYGGALYKADVGVLAKFLFVAQLGPSATRVGMSDCLISSRMLQKGPWFSHAAKDRDIQDCTVYPSSVFELGSLDHKVLQRLLNVYMAEHILIICDKVIETFGSYDIFHS